MIDPPAIRNPANGPCVLIADDDASILELLGTKFADTGFRPLLAPNGEAALEAAMVVRPTIILLDEGLPGLKGSEVCERLAGEREAAQIPVIIVTGYGRVRCTPANLQMIVAKPFSAENLVATVVAVVQRSKLISAA